jgi:hypothetical protein
MPMSSSIMVRVALAGALVALAGCAASRPVLYPGAKLESVSQAQVERDIEECRRLAERYRAAGRERQVARDTAVSSGVGAAAGAAGGAVYGSAGRGAAAGAAGGAAAGLLSGIFRAGEPSQAYRNAVAACLEERGYRVIGWE